MTTYRPRCIVHPDRYGPVKTLGRNRLLVVHTSEGGETTNSAENLCTFMQSPGDRTNPDGSKYGASYQYVTDTDRSVIPATLDNVVAYAAAGANHDGIHICIPGKAGQTRAQWLDADSTGHRKALADVMVDKALEQLIPLRKLSVQQVRDGWSGYCGHHDVSLAFGRSTHTDPGGGFPWDLLATDLMHGGLIVADKLALKDYRLYDSREHPEGKVLAPRAVGITDPAAAGAVAALVNLTVTETEAPGYLTAYATTDTGTSKVNWSGPAQNVANEVTVPLSAFGTFMVRAKTPCHVIVDVVGYWMP